jgi:CBS domain-containing membrane protein
MTNTASQPAPATRLTAAEVMSTPVMAVTPEHSLIAAWEAMRARGVHHVVVLSSGRVTAVLDDRTVAARWPAGGPEAAHRMFVGDLVEWGVHCVRPDASVTVIAQVMRRTRSDGVPVVTTCGELVGLVTATDLVAALAGEVGGVGGDT